MQLRTRWSPAGLSGACSPVACARVGERVIRPLLPPRRRSPLPLLTIACRYDRKPTTEEEAKAKESGSKMCVHQALPPCVPFSLTPPLCMRVCSRYSDRMKLLGTFHTVEDFWRCVSTLCCAALVC